MPHYFIGLMSGTSLDGVDAVLADFAPGQALSPVILAHAHRAMPAALRDELLALHVPAHDELHRAARASQALARLYAQVCHDLLAQADLPADAVPANIRAIGAHGQTVRHRPESGSGADNGYTLQLNAPALLAELTGISVVADFRSRDLAAGGQGAPLAPILHQAMFRQKDMTRVVLNLGGIANLTVLPPALSSAPVIGLDTGPANMLLDAWFQRHHPRSKRAYDTDGQWAASGKVNAVLLNHLLQSEPWLNLPAPKSTGRDLFSLRWLEERLKSSPVEAQRPQDVQATLLAFTAHTVAQAMMQIAPQTSEVLVCGGGAHNPRLVDALQAQLPCPVRRTDVYGLPACQVEALAFAWLAHAHLCGQSGNLPSVTGARAARILGCVYPA